MIKLNVGASPIWSKDGWHTLDHKTRDESVTSIQGDAANIPLDGNSCSTVFTSHMFEHIPHVKLEDILLEFNRVLDNNGVLRILTPNLKRVAQAYIEEDAEFFKEAKLEDESLRTDLGYGGMLMNFIVSPGQDTALYDRGLNNFIAGYAHLYCYDFNMFDTYGDGWQGGSYVIVDSLSNVISSGNLQGSYTFGSNIFSINSSACPVLGCTLPFAVNYNPSATADDTTCTFLSDNVTLLFNWADTSLPTNGLGGSYTDVYGIAINGGEYAVIGSTMGTHIIDVTNPTQSYEAAFVPGAQQYNVTHRDFFHMDHYLYCVCDQGTSTLQIIDISNLPNSVNVVYDSDSLISTSHNMFIDTLNKKLYSTNGDVLDISNPISPSFLFNMGFSCHDLYVDNDTGYFNCGGNGLQIYEMTTNSPQYVGSLTSYPHQGGNHSGWKKDNIYTLADENHGYSLKMIDVSDLNNLQVIALFNSEVDSMSIPHNLIIRDKFVYVSYYHDGLQIFDITDPAAPIKAGYYDTYLPDNHNGFAGNWGVDPLLPSGIILVSDVQSGLFVLEFDYNPQSICEGDSILFDTSFVSNQDLYLTNTLDSMGYVDILIMLLSIDSISYSI